MTDATMIETIMRALVQEHGLLYGQNDFYLLYGNSGLRWVIPTDSAYGLPVLEQWRPYKFTSLLKWKLLLALYRLGLLKHLRVARYGRTIGGNELRGQDGTPQLIPVVYIGTPGPERKAVVSMVSASDREIVSILKMPLADGARLSIHQEAEHLSRLSVLRPGFAPTIFSGGDGQTFTSQSPVVGRLTGRRFAAPHVEWLLALPSGKSSSTMTRQRQALVEVLKDCSPISADFKVALAEQISRLTDERRVNHVWVHGDFAPWNLKQRPDGGILAIDWESALEAGLPMFDICHFHVIQAFLFAGPDPMKKIQTSKYVQRYKNALNLDEILCKQLCLFYLISSALKQLDLGNITFAAYLLAQCDQV